MSTRSWLIGGGVMALVLLVAVAFWEIPASVPQPVAIAVPVPGEVLPRDQAQEGTGLPVMGRLPEFVFPAHCGGTLGLRDLRGKVWVADFFFTRCAGICPVMNSQMQRLQEAFAGNPEVKLVSFTVDPETDTAEVLADYAQARGARAGQWYFLTGEKPALYGLARRGFRLSASEGDGGPADFIHSDRLVLVDRQGRLRGYYHGTEPASVDRLANDLRALLGERP